MSSGVNKGGRPKGSLSANKLVAIRKLKKLKCDPIKELVEIGMSAKEAGDLPIAVQCFKELAQYVHPKLKSIEHKLDDDTRDALTVNGTTGLPKIGDQPTSETTTDTGVTRH